MKLGGVSYNNGINFVSENYLVKMVMDKDKCYSISSKKKAKAVGRLDKFTRKIPILKGLYFLFLENRSYGLLIIIFIILELFSLLLPVDSILEITYNIMWIVFLVIIVSLVVKKIVFNVSSTLRFHGAEHKTIYAVTNGMELTVENIRKCPRIAKRCGTNLAVFIIVFLLLLNVLINDVVISFILAYVLGYELFNLKKGDTYPVIKWFFKFGYWCQEHLFTKEPTDDQLIAAIAAVKELKRLERKG